MRKFAALLLTVLLTVSLLAACGSPNAQSSPPSEAAPAASSLGPSVTSPEDTGPLNTEAVKTETQFPITLPMYFYFGTQVEQTYEKVPERVLVHGQDMVDIMVYFGLEDKIVGVTRGANIVEESGLPEKYNDILAGLPVISEDFWPSAEVVVAAEPDLIATSVGGLFSSLSEVYPDVENYNKLGINIYEVTNNASGLSVVTMDDYFDSLVAFGKLFNIQDDVNAYVDAQKEMINAYSDNGGKSPSVLAIAYNSYGGERSWVKFPASAMVTAISTYMGAANYAEPDIYDISAEGIVELDPDIVLISIVQEADIGMALEEFTAMPEISVLRAVEEGHVYLIREDDISFGELYNGKFDMSHMVERLGTFIYPVG